MCGLDLAWRDYTQVLSPFEMTANPQLWGRNGSILPTHADLGGYSLDMKCLLKTAVLSRVWSPAGH